MGQNSYRAFVEAQKIIPGGVNSPARAFGAVGGRPLFISHGLGSHIFDIDGKCSKDALSAWKDNQARLVLVDGNGNQIAESCDDDPIQAVEAISGQISTALA